MGPTSSEIGIGIGVGVDGKYARAVHSDHIAILKLWIHSIESLGGQWNGSVLFSSGSLRCPHSLLFRSLLVYLPILLAALVQVFLDNLLSLLNHL